MGLLNSLKQRRTPGASLNSESLKVQATYVICVTGVTKTGWVYDASLNTDDACAVYELPPFPAPYPW